GWNSGTRRARRRARAGARCPITGAIRREVANLRAERATGLSERDWQRASGPHVTRMLATGRFPALARFVHDGDEVDAETSFATGLDWILDAVAAKLTRPPA
ncbi:TetR/AcrR family transcriptional regulator C-terminal domain-containing protein, partial [Nonomuraea sp. NPDC004297]